MAPRKLTVEQTNFVERITQEMVSYDNAAEHHASILRKNPDGYFVAYEQYAKKAAPVGYVPKPGELDKCIADSKAAISKNCTTVEKHIQAMSAALFLAQLVGAQAADFPGRDLLPIVLGERTRLHAQHPLTPDSTTPNSANLPPSLVTAVAHTAFIPTTDPPLTARLQNTVICPVFDFTPYTKCTRVPVTSHNIETWKRNIFVTRNEDGDDEPFIIQSYTRTRVGVGIGSAGKEYIYYVQVAGEDEAVGYAAKEFFELLERSFCVSS